MKSAFLFSVLFATSFIFQTRAHANCTNFSGRWKGVCETSTITGSGKTTGSLPVEFSIFQKDCTQLIFTDEGFTSKIGKTISGSESYPPDYDFHWSSSGDWGPGLKTYGWITDEQFRKRDSGVVRSNQDNGVYSLVNGKLMVKEITNMIDWKNQTYVFSRATYNCTLDRVSQALPKEQPRQGPGLSPTPQGLRLLHRLKALRANQN